MLRQKNSQNAIPKTAYHISLKGYEFLLRRLHADNNYSTEDLTHAMKERKEGYMLNDHHTVLSPTTYLSLPLFIL
ncbi:MAG: hypothetical protein K2M98_08190 [Muribaculum sp.]|nr:hypothetical protein [Muribaculum sp.]